MSSPLPPSSAVPLVIVAHDGTALALEQAAATAASGPITEALKSALSWAHVEWIKRFGRPRELQAGDTFTEYIRELTDRLANVRMDPAATLLDYARKARVLGTAQGFIEAGVRPVDIPDAIEFQTHVRVAKAVQKAQAKLDSAPILVGNLQRGSFLTVNRAMAPAQQAANIIHRTARTIVNEELNTGLATVAQEVGGRLLWVAERDGCVSCQALSGYFARNGEFNWKRTFGAKAYAPKDEDGNEIALTGPPRHPNCRCRVTPWLGHDTAAAQAVTHDWAQAITDAEASGDHVAVAAAQQAAEAARVSAATGLPTALRREAERSILNGYALPSESEGVRRKAADRLLSKIGEQRNSPSPSGWLVPASVKKKTGRALKTGTFTTGPVPSGR